MLIRLPSYLHRVSERQKSLRDGQRRTAYNLFHNNNAMKLSWITPENENIEMVWSWQETERIHVFKRDLYTVDLICLVFKSANSRTLEINEEMDGWESLVEKLPEYFPGCQKFEKWFLTVAFPLFKPNVTQIYRRRDSRERRTSQQLYAL